MASESCKILALFDHQFLCLRQDNLRSDGWTWFLHLDITLQEEIREPIKNGSGVDFSCDLMPLTLVTFNDDN